MLRAHGDDEGGVGVAEVLLASSILLLAVLGCAKATLSGIAAQGRAIARERATIATDDAVEILRSNGCLFLTGAEVRVDADAVAARCRAGVGLPAGAAMGGGNGRIDAGSRPLDLAFQSRWVGPTVPADPVPCTSPYYAQRPTGVAHWVTVTYRDGRRDSMHVEARAIVAAPTDRYTLRSWQRSNLVVAAPVGASGELVGPAGIPVRRAADPNGCIWFPALRTGTYLVRVQSSSGALTTTSLAFTADPRRAEPQVVAT